MPPLRILTCLAALPLLAISAFAAAPVKLGFNYPETGPYAAQGADQLRAARLALDEINAAGGILGRPAELVIRDSKSKVDVTKVNVAELIDQAGVKMVFGGSASNVAVAAGQVCQEKGVPFFGTLTYATGTTCEDAQRHTFRECYDSWAAARVLAAYINKTYAGKKFLYVTADYNWGHSTEASFRKLTGTEDKELHKTILTPFPGATEDDFKKALSFAKLSKPDVLVLVSFGADMVYAVRQATAQGLKSKSAIIVPNLTLTMAEAAGPKIMEGVIGALPWDWSIPYKYNYASGISFVESYAARYKRYPCTAGASAYTIVHEYKAAVERAGSFDSPAVVRALENHRYTRLKDEQVWRAFDHQSAQTVYAVRCKPEAQVLADKFQLDYFEVIDSLPGDQAFLTREEWNARRVAAGKSTSLQPLPGE
jgi:ABC-type branched-subunit amino acid transport system substrate-binding protein